MKILDIIALLVLIICGCCSEADEGILEILCIATICTIYLLIRLTYQYKKTVKEEELNYRKEVLAAFERERRSKEWMNY